MFLTFPYIEQAITRFDRWSTSHMAMFRHLRQPPRGGGSDNVRFADQD